MRVILGAQWGDEGKGKLVDLLATEADVVCRCAVSMHCHDIIMLFCTWNTTLRFILFELCNTFVMIFCSSLPVSLILG